jgi:phosphate transport system protein
MPREKFDHDLRHLQGRVLAMGQDVEQAIGAAVEALRTGDLERSRELIEKDRLINEKRYSLENDALILIATQQPMAGDLRALAAVIEIAGELERMADYAKGIANITLMIRSEKLIKPLVDIPFMAEKARQMLQRALDAYSRCDVDLARAIPRDDTEVDRLYEKVFRDLLELINRDPSNLDQATRLTWAAHNLERVADRVSNICQRVVFTATGRIEHLT